MDPTIQLREDNLTRGIERSRSYSEAMKNSKVDNELINLADSQVYTNDDIKRKYRISQTLVEGKEILFPHTRADEIDSKDDELKDMYKDCIEYLSQSDDTDEENVNNGLVMKIDIENDEQKVSESMFPVRSRDNSQSSGQPLIRSNVEDSDLNTIEVELSSCNNTTTSPTIPDTASEFGRTFPMRYSSRRKKQSLHRDRARHGGARRQRSRRVVMKNGEENVPLRQHIPRKSIKYMRDVVNTVINSKWRCIIIMMILSHFIFWIFFATIWYSVTRSYQDDLQDGKEHCVSGTSSFAGMLMMAVETQMTIGYGVRYPNEECPEAILVMVLEIIAGTALSGGLSSLLFAKLVRPQKHVTSVGFSRKAAICLRDGELCLQFRVWDLLCQHTINSAISAYLLKPIRTLEGEHHQNFIHQLELKEARSFLLWPITVVHVIDESSPLYTLAAQDMMDYRFEIVVCLTGASQSMGTTTQSRTSYLSKEIIWGYRFMNVLKYSKTKEAYVIDVDNLNTVEQVVTPLCSAAQLKGVQDGMHGISTSPTDNSFPTDINPGVFSDDSSLISKLGVSPTQSYSELSAQGHGIQQSSGWAYTKAYENNWHRDNNTSQSR